MESLDKEAIQTTKAFKDLSKEFRLVGSLPLELWEGSANFSVKGQIINIFDFVDHMVCVMSWSVSQLRNSHDSTCGK